MKFILLSMLLISPHFIRAQIDFQKFFDECNIPGSITLYDYQNKKWLFSDSIDSQKATLPASTFKIMNTLIALETKVVADEKELIKWHGNQDTAKYGYRPNIYHDMSMQEAFRLSAGWAYVELAKKIGKPRYKKYLSKARYGNGDLSIEEADFWNFGNFAITPYNQIEILISIYEETLPFSKRGFQILKNIMLVEQNENYTLRAKTGWTRDKGKDTGWWVGYIEKGNEVYFFATRLIKDRKEKASNFGKCRIEITKNILRALDILP